jgi:hypothetical protein
MKLQIKCLTPTYSWYPNRDIHTHFNRKQGALLSTVQVLKADQIFLRATPHHKQKQQIKTPGKHNHQNCFTTLWLLKKLSTIRHADSVTIGRHVLVEADRSRPEIKLQFHDSSAAIDRAYVKVYTL